MRIPKDCKIMSIVAFTLISEALVIGLCGTALIGWFFGIPRLTSLGSEIIPMAPSTAVLFLLLGISLFFHTGVPQKSIGYRMGVASSFISLLVSLPILIFSTKGVYWNIEHLGLPISERFSNLPVGHMSPLTAFCFLLASTSILLSLLSTHHLSKRVAFSLLLSFILQLIGTTLTIAYIIGGPLLYNSGIIPPALNTSLACLGLGTAISLSVCLRIWPSNRLADSKSAFISFVVTSVFLLLSMGIVAAGYFSFQSHKKHFFVGVEKQLAAVAELKMNELTNWRQARLKEAGLFFENYNFSERVVNFLENPNDNETLRRLQNWIEKVQNASQYDRVFLLDEQFNVRMSIPDSSEPAEASVVQNAAEALSTGKIVFQDFYYEEMGEAIHLSILVPLFTEGNNRRVLGVLVFQITPQIYLYPFIAHWPIPSQSAETLLLRLEGDHVLFLNPLRFQPDAALKSRIPLSQEDVLSVKAIISEGEIIVDRVDYRNVPSIGVLRAVPDSPWFLIARMDWSEAIKPLYAHLWEMVGFIGILILGLGACIGLLWRDRQARFYMAQYESSEALRISESRFRAIIDNTKNIVWVKDLEGRFLIINQYAEQLMKKPIEDIIGRTVFDLFPSNLAEEFARNDRQVIQSGIMEEFLESSVSENSKSTFLSVKFPLFDSNNQCYALGAICTDITKIIESEAQIIKLNRIYALLSETNQAIVRIRDIQALYEKICRIAVEQGGFHLAWIGLLDDSGSILHPIAYSSLSNVSIKDIKILIKNNYPCKCPLQSALREGRYAICDIKENHKSHQNCLLLPGAIECRSIAAFPLKVFGQVKGTISFAAQKANCFDETELRLLGELALDLSFAMEFAEQEKERKKAEEEREILFQETEKLNLQLYQVQKMEAVGRLAGGVAHDFNNIIMVINGYSDLVLRRILEPNDVKHDIQEIMSAANRAALLTRQLLAFSRKQTINPIALNLNESISDMHKMLHRLIGEDIELVWKPGSDLWEVRMDPSQIDQVLANIVINSRDAIEGVGKITIETSNVEIDNHFCSEHVEFIPGNYVMLAVSDNGCGIDKDKINIIFEPFYTTKELGKGTGLGLSTVYGIVKQNEGFINVYSEPGVGTTFRIYFPKYDNHSHKIQHKKQDMSPSGGVETILVVEDDLKILNLGKRFLQQLGYTVLIANTPSEAINLVEKYPGTIHLLISDVVMPEMNGRELMEKIKTLMPEMKCLFMSGYTANIIANRGVLQEDIHFIQKPFSMEMLDKKIRETLEND